MMIDLCVAGITGLFRHYHAGDDDVRAVLFELCQRRGSVGSVNHIYILAAKSDLDDFAHGGAVVDEVDIGCPFGRSFAQRWNGHRFAHSASLSAMSRVPSSYSRMASSMRSVAERNTVRCVDAVP